MRVDALAPFTATPDDPWDREKAAHLARRAAFGATQVEVGELVTLGCQRAVHRFVDADPHDAELASRIAETGGILRDVDDPERPGQPLIENLRRWWLYRMVHTRAPFVEKLALFWHDHFACQEAEDLRATLVLEQNQLFRRSGGDTFAALLAQVSRDAAMLCFLDARTNVKQRPNENWARELLELFTLGVDHYTQSDVAEIARAFTGWTTEELASTRFVFRPEIHDDGPKLVFGAPLAGRSGERGVEEGDEVLQRILARGEWTERLAAKLAAWFVSDDPCREISRALAERLSAGESIRAVLAALFCSRAFYAPEVRRALYKNPVELVVTAARHLQLQNSHLLAIDIAVRDMGLHLFRPPSVAGWKKGKSWIHAGALLARAEFAGVLSRVAHSSREVSGTPVADFDALAPTRGSLGSDKLASADASGGPEIARAAAERLDCVSLSDARADAIGREIEAAGPSRRARTRRAVEILLAAPEFALC